MILKNEQLYFTREKEDNWDYRDRAEELGLTENLKYMATEVVLTTDIDLSTGECRVISINGADVSNLNIYI